MLDDLAQISSLASTPVDLQREKERLVRVGSLRMDIGFHYSSFGILVRQSGWLPEVIVPRVLPLLMPLLHQLF